MRTSRGTVRTMIPAILSCLTAAPAAEAQTLSFTEVTQAAGFDYEHGYQEEILDHYTFYDEWTSNGVAAGDYDRDGWVDLYVTRGDIGPNLLFRNRGDGTFEEVAAALGVAISNAKGAGPAFGDWDGDGWLDLFIGGIKSTAPRLFKNLSGMAFTEVTQAAGLGGGRGVFSCSMGDYDRDGDLDLLLTRWGWHHEPCDVPCTGHLWRNEGDGSFTDVDTTVGITGFDDFDYSYTGNFADIDSDGWPDLLIAADFGLWTKVGRSRVFRNQGDATFEDLTDPTVITDENGMGAAVGDYDNDGDLDWFVTSVYDAPPVDVDLQTRTGNRLYRNAGDGTFEDVSEAAGVRLGYFGWGACFADFNLDTDLDIFHVNGFTHAPWLDDPSRLFLSDGDGTFTESAAAVGLIDRDEGRSVVCFDYDADGDVDIFVANSFGPPSLYRNELLPGTGPHFLRVLLKKGEGANYYGVGAHIHVTTSTGGGQKGVPASSITQMREVRVGSNYASQQPLAVHFGLGDATVVDQLTVRWPNGEQDSYQNVAADQLLELAPVRIFADGFEGGDTGAWALP